MYWQSLIFLAYLVAMPALFAAFCAITPEPNHNQKRR